MWTLLGAQQPRAKRGVSWEWAGVAAGKYRTVLDNSGLVEIDNSLPPNIDAEDLSALCQARERAIEIARVAGASNLGAVGTEQDPVSNERRVTAERYLAAISTYVGDVDGAILHFTSARDAIVPWVADSGWELSPTTAQIGHCPHGTGFVPSGPVEA
jgi:hypothetical protein